MKNVLIRSVACAVVLSVAGVAHADTYGNTNPFEIQSSHSQDYVLGVQVNVPVNGFTLTSFGMMYGHEDFGGVAISNAIFGLYTSDGNGLPQSLVAVTNPINLNTQQTYDNIAFTSSPTINAGTYWMMALYESFANPRMGVQDGSSMVAYWSNSYASGMPGTAPAVTTYFGQNFNYWVNGDAVPTPGAIAAFGAFATLGKRRRRTA